MCLPLAHCSIHGLRPLLYDVQACLMDRPDVDVLQVQEIFSSLGPTGGVVLQESHSSPSKRRFYRTHHRRIHVPFWVLWSVPDGPHFSSTLQTPRKGPTKLALGDEETQKHCQSFSVVSQAHCHKRTLQLPCHGSVEPRTGKR